MADLHAMLRACFAGFAAPVSALIDGTPTILRNDIVDLPVLPRWTTGRVTLLGDASSASPSASGSSRSGRTRSRAASGTPCSA